MFNWFKKKEKSKSLPLLIDMQGNELKSGDLVTTIRYDMGECRLYLEDEVFYYESIASGKVVKYTKMIDAITRHQKVIKKSD
ncbi:MAG: hypothetical protein JXQ90_01540 [Cyclobacteriaceae bacterium]